MKHITKKIIALLVSAVTAVTTLSASYSAVFAETEQEMAASSADSDYEIKSGGLLGSLMPDEFQSLAEENEEAKNSDYAVYKLEYDKSMENLIVSYTAKKECTIFVGFYNDEGTQLYTSVTETVIEGNNKMMAIKKPDGLPEYYLIKAFMVGEFYNPVSKSCTYDKCTQAVQEILDKTIDDLEKECEEGRVIQFSENDKESFIVTKDAYVTIYSDDTKDTFIEQREDDKYVFKNYDKVKNLSEGQTVLVYTPKEMLLFVVDTIDIKNGELIITKKPVNLEDIVSLIRFDTDNYANEPVVECNVKKGSIFEDYEILDYNSSNEKVSENGISRAPAPGFTQQLPTVSKKIVFKLPKRFKADAEMTEPIEGTGISKNTEINIEMGGFIEVGFELDMEVYYSEDVCSLRGTYDQYFEIGIEGEVSINQNIGKIEIYLFPISFSVMPTLHVRLNGKASLKISKAYDIEVIDHKIHCTPHEAETSINGEVSLEITIGFDIGINFLSSHVLHIGVEPEFGVKWVLTESSKDDNDYTHHDCVNCYSLTKSNIFRLSFHFSVMGIELWRENGDDDGNIGYESEREMNKADILHWSDGNWYDGPCDNISHKIILHVKEVSTDSNGKETTKPVSGASAYNGQFISDSEKFTENGEAIVTDKNGSISLWVKDKLLSDENYCVTVKTPDNKAALVHVGKNWDPTLNKANEYNVVIDIDNDSVAPDEGISYPITGNCGYPRTTLLGDIEYDDVTFTYWSSAECVVTGSGTLYEYKLRSELGKKGIKTIKKLQIGNGVEVNSSASLGSDIEEVEFLGNNGKVLSTTFSRSNNLKKVTLSDFEELDYDAFVECENLEEIEGTYYLKKIGPYAFSGCSKLTKFDFSHNLEEIAQYAFRDTAIKELVCSKNLKEIHSLAFGNCKNLTSIKLNDGLEVIEREAFDKTGLKSVNIPASVKEIGENAFFGCTDLRIVTINGDINNNNYQPFSNSPVETLIMNDGVTRINDRFFSGVNKELKYVRFSKNLKSIGASAFQVTALTNINLPDSLETIGKDAFNGTRLTSVTIPKSVTEIGASAFDCDTLKEIVIFNYNCDLKEKVVPKSTIIWGYTGSTAEAYANKYGNLFKALDPPAVTSTNAMTTVKTTTTTAAVVTTQVAPDSECVFIAVKDEKSVDVSADEVLDRENVRFFDQQTANGDGVVSFSYLPDEKEKWAFIFVSEAINDTITKAFGTPDDLKTTTYNVAPGVKGDANGDGEIDMSDVVLIMQALANPNKYGVNGTNQSHITSEGFEYADTDGNGLTVSDALRIQQYLLGLIPSLT